MQNRGTNGPPINRNCGGDRPVGESSRRVCYYGLEKPSFDQIPFTTPVGSAPFGLGEIKHVRNQEITEWYVHKNQKKFKIIQNIEKLPNSIYTKLNVF